jgi:GT2 family glycosyltransferase
LTISDQVVDLIFDDPGLRQVLVIGSNAAALTDAFVARGFRSPDVVDLGAPWPSAPSDWVAVCTYVDDPARTYDVVVLSACSLAAPDDTLRRVADSLAARSSTVYLLLSPVLSGMPPDWYQNIGRWVEMLAEQGCYRDLSSEYPWMGAGLMRFHRSQQSMIKMLAVYEDHLQSLLQATRSLQSLALKELREGQAVAAREQEQAAEIQYLRKELAVWKDRWFALESGIAWPWLTRLQNLRAQLLPPGSRREALLDRIMARPATQRTLALGPVLVRQDPEPRETSVDIIVCVHNALEDVQRCLDSVLCRTEVQYSLILVDDGSAPETREFLRRFATEHQVTLIRNKEAQGYTNAANSGLRASTAQFCILLNSDTIVTSGWLPRMLACAASDHRIGIVGPLSNTASWQSVPEIAEGDDWAANALPEGMSLEEMGRWIAKSSARLYPVMPFLNGFCLMLRRTLIDDIGYFDAERFGRGYGEEDDYALRARGAGWKLALADDVYVFHAQSKSYSHDRRHQLSSEALVQLTKKHGREAIESSVDACLKSRVLEGIRARSRVLFERRALIQEGREKYAGKRLLFVLPVAVPGGGANIVVSEAMAMREMGVEVRIFNLLDHRQRFGHAYPDISVPVVFGTPADLGLWSTRYDAVVATHNESVAWLGRVPSGERGPVRGYYVQGFEPFMYETGSQGYAEALESYRLFPDLRCFAKTPWTRDIVLERAGVHCALVGPSFEVDLFRPVPRQQESWPHKPLRIAAMVRPEAPYRSPELTMSLLQRATTTYRRGVEAWVFGFEPGDPRVNALPHNFAWRSAGILDSRKVAQLLNEVDIFVDFSEHQAMGLTALEAMGCGAAVIVPSYGGATSFAREGENALVVDTKSEEACWDALSRLISDHPFRGSLQSNAIRSSVTHVPERAALATLAVLFSNDGRSG